HGEISALHRLCSDEVWHFYEGDPIELTTIDAVAGVALTQVLGEDIEAGQVRQAVLPAGCWFGGRLGEDGRSAGYALLGCTVAPGFEYQ
ncbi:cupin domain-containing protein, partial [Mycobacterium tuberculosis]|uniref:cupin domain-containing protein n=1 Tax=Mycobacterium tuberculosis TaxID=1773 RepID=UPI0021C58A82